LALLIIVQPGWALPQKKKKITGGRERERERQTDKEILVVPGEQRENA